MTWALALRVDSGALAGQQQDHQLHLIKHPNRLWTLDDEYTPLALLHDNRFHYNVPAI